MTNSKRQKFMENISNGVFENYREKIYKIIEEFGPISLKEIRDKGIAYTTASGRVSELMDYGVVKDEYNEVKEATDFTVVVEPEEIERRKNAREHEYFMNWYKRGMENGWFAKLATISHTDNH